LRRAGDDPRFGTLVDEIVGIARDAPLSGRPVTLASLSVADPMKAIALEAAVTTASGVSHARARLSATANYLLGVTFHLLKLKAGGFDAALYASDVAANADFRKFDDGVRVTLDCSPAFADAREARLAAAGERRSSSVSFPRSRSRPFRRRRRRRLHDGDQGGEARSAARRRRRPDPAAPADSSDPGPAPGAPIC
jgi:hypothetical protein